MLNTVRLLIDRVRNTPILTSRRQRPQAEESSSSHIEQRHLKQFLDKYYKGPVQILREVAIPRSEENDIPFIIEVTLVLKTIHETTENLHIMVKMLQDEQFVIGDNLAIMLRLDQLAKMKKEVDMHALVLATVRKFQKGRNIKEEKQFYNLFEKCIGTRISLNDDEFLLPDPSAAIIIEDLKFQEYFFEDEHLDFDLPTTKLVVQNLARIHAGPLALRLLDPKLFTENILPKLLLNVKEYEVSPPLPIKLSQELVRSSIYNVPKLLSDIEIINHVIELSCLHSWYSTIPKDPTWLTICHSRYWIPNIMVKRDSKGKAISSKATALYNLEYNSCCTNLAFFMFTSVQPQILEKHFDDILHVYFEAFSKVLKKHKINSEVSDKYSYDNFVMDFHRQGPKIIKNFFIELRTVACENRTLRGVPITGHRYREKVRTALKLMIKYDWIIIIEDKEAVNRPNEPEASNQD